MTHIIQFSGGKDSTALVLWAKEQGWPFTAVFCDTGWEHPLTYAYVQYINETVLGGQLVTLHSEGMEALVARKGRVPSTHARFCTSELKVQPFMDWMRTQVGDCVVYQGIRGAESASRSRMGRRVWSEDFDCWIERPLFAWTAEEVFEMHEKHGIQPNPLYLKGAARVGCFPCIMVNKSELRRLTSTLPDVWDRAETLERIAGRSFFKPDYIPARFHHGWDEKSGVSFPTLADVKFYVTRPDQPELWDDEPTRCLSVYNLCE